MADRTGRQQHASSHAGRVRRPNLSRYYSHKRTPIKPGEFEFTFDLLKRPHRLPLDKSIESVEWVDESAVLTGTLTLRRPDPARPKSLPFEHGWMVRCRTRPLGRGRWRELWRMRTEIPSVTAEEGQVEVALKDDLDVLRRNRRNWHFRKTKHRKRGFRCDEIARRVCRREGVKIGRLARGRHRFDKLERKDAGGLDVIRAAYAEETKRTGRKFVIRMLRGRLNVTAYRRNPVLYVFGPEIQSAVIQKTGKPRPITVLEGKARLGKGKSAKKIRHVEKRRRLIRRFGYHHVERDYGRVSSHAELKRRMRRDLAKEIRLKPSAEFTVAGVPYIHRGDGIYVHLESFAGRDEQSRNRHFVYITSKTDRVDSDGYTNDISVSVSDPYYKDRVRREREARDRKRRERSKK